jgi:hypothetical protein
MLTRRRAAQVRSDDPPRLRDGLSRPSGATRRRGQSPLGGTNGVRSVTGVSSSGRITSQSVSASWCEEARATDDFEKSSAVTIPEVLPPTCLMVITPSSCRTNKFDGSMITAPANRSR